MPLPNRRGILGYAIMGARDPKKTRVPVLYYQGTSGSRLSAFYLHKWAEKRGITLIVPERPGYGISTYERDYNTVDHARDVHSFVFDHLRYKRCRVLGISGSGSFALAMAFINSRGEVSVTGLISSVAPPEAGYNGAYAAARFLSFKLQLALRLQTRWQDRSKAKYLALIRSSTLSDLRATSPEHAKFWRKERHI